MDPMMIGMFGGGFHPRRRRALGFPMHHMMAGPPGIMGGPAALGGLGMIGGGFPGMMNMGMDGMSMGMYPGHGFSRLGGLNMMPGWGPMPRVRHRYYDSWDDIYDDDNDEDDEEPFIRELRRKRRLRRHAMGGGMGSPFGMGGGFMGAGPFMHHPFM